MKFFTLLAFLFSLSIYAQDPLYSEEFDTEIFSVGDAPTGYEFELNEEAWNITGTGTAAPWTTFIYSFHNKDGGALTLNAEASPVIYIRAKGTNSPELRIDLQDEEGYMTNQNPASITLTDNYQVYSLNYSSRLLDGAYGGVCTSGPCPVDPATLKNLLFFVNPPVGGYSGTIDIDWISVGASLGGDMPGSSYQIRYNQVSYLKGREKYLNITSSSDFEPVAYTIFDNNDTEVLTGTTAATSFWDDAQQYVSTVDISALDETGHYRFVTPEAEITFEIGDNYGDLTEASIKYYYYNRASTAITAQYGGEFARAAGHPDTQVKIHSSAASATRPTGTIISAPKGWYDAGDYNKYVVNSGISTYTLLAGYEHYPTYYNSLVLNIPEMGGDLPDILDEVLWNLDWMLDMQDPEDGGVYHKLTGLNFSGEIMPSAYNLDRYVVQKTTAAALNFAAVTAVASRIFKDFESAKPGFSAQLLEASKSAYAWAKANPTVYYNQPSDVATGAYGDNNVSDEFRWAAAELFITSGEDNFKTDLNVNSIGTGIPGWNNTDFLALISLAFHSSSLEDDIDIPTIESKLLGTATSLRSTVENSAMHIAMGNGSDYNWGSNGQAGNQLMILIRAYDLTGEETYLDAAYTGMDYLLGRNGTGYSFVTGYGDKSPMHPHHRISQADGISNPVPGMVVGGPNPGQQDGCSGYPNSNPATSYLDAMCSYASNEVTINWNAPFAYSINALQYYQNTALGLSLQDQEIRTKNLNIYPNPTSDRIYISDQKHQGNKYAILDISGKTVQKGQLPSEGIPVDQLKTGVYFLKFQGSKNSAFKFIKK